MPHLFSNHEWRSLMTVISLVPEAGDAPRLAAAALLDAHGETVRAAYIRACCQGAADPGRTVAGSVLPADPPFTPLVGWVPYGELLCFWERGFVTRVHGPLAVVRRDLPGLLLREPLYQSPDGPVIVTVSDRAAVRLDDADGEGRWSWGNVAPDPDQTAAEGAGPLLPPELFDLLPWPPMFDSAHTAAVALSTSLLSEAHELLNDDGR